jgi:hypothetical protein
MSEALNKDDKEFNRDQLAKEAYLASGIEVVDDSDDDIDSEDRHYYRKKLMKEQEERHARCWAPGPDEC